jgi:endonuclease/exonuclease/phosphatase family metal-dependent hydrolase
MHNLKITAWNLLWGNPGRQRGNLILERLKNTQADIYVLAEAMSPMISGHIVDAGPDWGYGQQSVKRKIQMISRQPWTDIKREESPAALKGRFICATTKTPIGAVRVIGVCIPWFMAHVTSGRKDASRWSEHLEFLVALQPIIKAECRRGLPLILAGDFNQCLPRRYARKDVYSALRVALGGALLPSQGIEIPGHSSGLLNHIAIWPMETISAKIENTWSGYEGEHRLSDHAGLCVSLSKNPA